MAQLVHTKADGPRWPCVFSHYFNEKDKTKVESFFRAMISAKDKNDPGKIGTGGGSALFEQITITNKRIDDPKDHSPKGRDISTTVAWLDFETGKPDASLRLCDKAYEFPLLSQRHCTDMDAVSSGKMSLLAGLSYTN